MRKAALAPLLVCVAAGWALPQFAHSDATTPQGQGCSDAERYLEPYLARKPDPNFCGQCAINEANQFFGITQLVRDTQVAAASQGGPLSKQAPLAEACFVASMHMRPEKGVLGSHSGYHYTTCENNEARPSRALHKALPPPCIEPALAQTVQSAFNSTMNCLGVDQHEMFSLIGWESHFQINVYNSGGTGIGQVTGHAISDVDLNKRFAEDLYKPECQQFASVFKSSAEQYQSMKSKHISYIPLRSSHVCEWIASMDNPARNLLYAGATYRLDKRDALALASRIGKTHADVEKIATELARYMYNGGSGAIRNLVRLKYGLRGKGQRVSYEVFKHGSKTERPFREYVERYFGDTEDNDGDPAIKERVASYTQHIDRDARRVEKETGGAKCSE